MLAMTGSMHTNSDINRVHLAQHVEDEKENGNWLMNAVWLHEQNGLIKVAEGITSFYLKESQEYLQNVKDAIKNKAQEMNERNWEERKVHAYLKSKLSQDENIDHTQTNKWMNYPSVTSHEEGFLMAIQEQEIATRAVRKAREKDPQKKTAFSPVCRLCQQKEENIFHIVCSCTSVNVPTHQA